MAIITILMLGLVTLGFIACMMMLLRALDRINRLDNVVAAHFEKLHGLTQMDRNDEEYREALSSIGRIMKDDDSQ